MRLGQCKFTLDPDHKPTSGPKQKGPSKGDTQDVKKITYLFFLVMNIRVLCRVTLQMKGKVDW